MNSSQRQEKGRHQGRPNPPGNVPELSGTIPSESTRHLCLATAGIGSIYWLLLIRDYPAGILLILMSGWIVGRSLGAVHSPAVAIVVSLILYLVLLGTKLPEPPAPHPCWGNLCPFVPKSYLGMLLALAAADSLDLLQLCVRLRHVRSWFALSGQTVPVTGQGFLNRDINGPCFRE